MSRIRTDPGDGNPGETEDLSVHGQLLPLLELTDAELADEALAIFSAFLRCQKIIFDEVALCSFLITIRKGYNDVPYHCWRHAVSVLSAVAFYSLSSDVILPPEAIIQQYLAAICHDVVS